MNKLKLITTIIATIALLVSFGLATGCQSEPEPPVEAPAPEPEPAAEEEPMTEEETVLEEEAAEEPVEEEVTTEPGNPELLWSFEHEDLDFKLNCVAASPNNEILVVGAYLTTYTHLLYDGSLINVNASHNHSVDDIGFSPDGSILGIGVALGGVSLIDMEDDQEIINLHGGYDNRLSFSPDGKHVATGNRNGQLWVWDMENGEQIMELEPPEVDMVRSIDYHPSGNLLAGLIWTDPGTVYIWDLETEEIVQEIELEILAGSTKSPFKFSPDGNIMAGYTQVDWDHKITLWNVEGGEVIAEFPFEKGINEIAFSPDGSLLAVGSLYQETTIWDVNNKTLLYTLDQTLEENTDGTKALAFTPDGGHLAVVRNDGPLEMWRFPGADPLPEPEIDMKEPPPLPSDVLFDTGSSELKAGSDQVLEEFASGLYSALPAAKITFIGHTDSRGDAASNLQLSLDRATAVKEWFEKWADDNGADGWEFTVDGKGDTELKVQDVDAEGTFREEAGKINRRVEIETEVSS